VVGIQLLNPIHNRSTEDIVIYDARTVNASSHAWSLRRDLVVFPTISSSFGVLMQYHSGSNALGGAVLAVSTVPGNYKHILLSSSSIIDFSTKWGRLLTESSTFSSHLSKLLLLLCAFNLCLCSLYIQLCLVSALCPWFIQWLFVLTSCLTQRAIYLTHSLHEQGLSSQADSH
jgi:hypothetical protein